MRHSLKRRCCNSLAIALALAWSVLMAEKAIDFIENSGDEQHATNFVASATPFYP